MLPSIFQDFIERVKRKNKQLNQAIWLLETTGHPEAAHLKAELEIELNLLFSNKELFDQIVAEDQKTSDQDPLLKRQLNVLIRAFKPYLVSQDLLEKISNQEAHLSLLYSNFRPEIEGEKFSENEIREILKTESEVAIRKQVWSASKQIGHVMAPSILNLVNLRNESARQLGYSNYFSMQLELQEVDENHLFNMLEELAEKSDAAYLQVIDEIKTQAAARFNVSKDEVGPWAWSDPFCQEDPLDVKELDHLTEGLDLLKASQQFYEMMNFDVQQVLEKSDNFERPGKNQHAFCIHIDREGDVRTLNNVNSSMKWFETVFHELGHAIYEMGYSQQLPWLLKEPPHMITTEAMALLAGRQVYRHSSLKALIPNVDPHLTALAEKSLKRRQLIFSRWVMVMTYFERELYRHPDQDLNRLWWKIVEKYQHISSENRENQCDWAAKYHIALAPVYYFSYLLGELFASSLELTLPSMPSKEAGLFLNENLFQPGNALNWSELIKKVTGQELNSQAWLSQFS